MVACGFLSACATVEPIDCLHFPAFGPAATDDELTVERRELLVAAQSYPSPDRVALAAGYAALEEYETAFDMASLPDGSGSREEAHLAIVGFAATNGAIDVARRALEPINYQRNQARANLALAVALGKVGRRDEALAAEEMARNANSGMVRPYAFHSLLSQELTELGNHQAALREAEEITGEYWSFRANAMIRVAWSRYQDGDIAGALKSLNDVQQLADESGSAGSRIGLFPEFELVLADMYVIFGDHASAIRLLRTATDINRHDPYGRNDFLRVSALLTLNRIIEETGLSEARALKAEVEQLAIENLIILDQRIGYLTGLQSNSKAELVRLLIEDGRSEFLNRTADTLGRYPRTALISAIALARASLGDMDLAEDAVMQLETWRDRCTALAAIYVEIATEDRRQDSVQNTMVMEREGCNRLSVVFPHALYSNLAIEAARLGDHDATCAALKSVGDSDVWRHTVAGITAVRAERYDPASARSVMRWAHATGNIDGTEASAVLAVASLIGLDNRDGSDEFPPVLGQTRLFAGLQLSGWRYPIWFDDGIWDQ